MSKLKSHTADIDVTCSAPWRRLHAPAAILRLMRSPVLTIVEGILINSRLARVPVPGVFDVHLHDFCLFPGSFCRIRRVSPGLSLFVFNGFPGFEWNKRVFLLRVAPGAGLSYCLCSGHTFGVPIYLEYSIGKELPAGALHRDGPDHDDRLPT
jgi:hypothetical protein